VGYRSFLNFFASYSVADVAAIDAKLKEAQSRVYEQRLACSHISSVPIIAAGHQPLSVTQYSSSYNKVGHCKYGPQCAAQELKQGRVVRLQDVLAAYGVGVFVSGHLHNVFGNHMHVFHQAANLTGASQAKMFATEMSKTQGTHAHPSM
jgi:hypothetical protein